MSRDPAERLRADVARVLEKSDDSDYVIAGILAVRRVPYLRDESADALEKFRAAVGDDRFEQLERAATRVADRPFGDRLPAVLEWEPVEVAADWLARHRPFGLRTAAEIAADAANSSRRWLLRGVWPQHTYGALAGRNDAGKTVLAVDLAVSVSSGTDWFGQVPVDVKGPVILFYAEGSRDELLRRGRAIAASRGLVWDELSILAVNDVPRLRDDAAMVRLREALEWRPPVLVIVDPLYVAAEGATSSQLFDMGATLRPIQRACQDAGASLLVNHHHNAAGGLTGAGVAEWARVIINVTAESSTLNPINRRTDVTVMMQAQGNEIGGVRYQFRRSMWTDDPDDLQSAMHYEVAPVTEDKKLILELKGNTEPKGVTDVLRFVQAHDGACGRDIHVGLSPLSERVVRAAAKWAVAEGLLEANPGPKKAVLHHLTEAGRDVLAGGRP